MELIYQKRCEDWGWFIDIENNKIINHNYKTRKSLGKLSIIKEVEEECEDSFDYYKQIYKDTEEIYLNKEIEDDNFEKETNIIFYKNQTSLFELTSRTIITITTAYILLSIFNLIHSS